MLFKLPPSLLALVFCVLESGTVAADPAPAPHYGNIAGYIASGLGANNGSLSPTPSLASTGTGYEYASRCQNALETWSSSSFSYQWSSAHVTTYTFSSAITDTLEKPGTTQVTSIITLCDGHPRVVGHTSASRGADYTTTNAWTNTVTESKQNTDFPTPAPCSIQPEDCKDLSSKYEVSLSSAIDESGFATGGGPLCTVTPSVSPTYSTDRGNVCSNCMIHASTARVMFWPVTTASGGNLCNKTASTITSSPTGPPQSFVTEGITITSPTVAVSLGFMSRVDGCGTTINHTIIPVKPEEVTSVRGFRALFEHHRFNFADLNYFCMDTGTTNYTLDDNVSQDSCYQQVPADAYFGGLNNAVVLDQFRFRNLTKEQLTIWNNYQPQLLPPQTMTDAINSLWGDNCIIHPDGVWDPPIALTPEATVKGPSYGPGETTKDSEPESTPASPINNYGPFSPEQTRGIKGPSDGPSDGDDSSKKQHFTALPETTGGSSQGGQDGGDDTSSDKGGHDSSSGSNEQDSYGNGDGTGDGDSASAGPDAGQNNGDSSDGSDGSDGSNGSDRSNSSDGSDDPGSSDGSNNSDGSNGSSDKSDGSSPGVTKVHTTVITVGSKTMTCSEDSNGAWAIPDSYTTHMVSPGGSVAAIDGATFTAAASGLTQVHSFESEEGDQSSSEDRSQGSGSQENGSQDNGSQDTGSPENGSSDSGSSENGSSGKSSNTSSESDEPATATSETSTQQSSQANREQSTDAASPTNSGAAPASSSSEDSEASGAGNVRWSPETFALAMVAIYLCAL